MNFFYNILITGCASGLGEALFNETCKHDHLKSSERLKYSQDFSQNFDEGDDPWI